MKVNTINEIAFELGEHRLAGLAKGDSNASVILCLHGWLDNAASFVPLMNELEGYHLIAIDWPGHGHSSHRSQDAHYHFIDYVYDLLLLFEHTQWQAIDIVAHSMGGMVASAFAAAFPEKVRSLTLIDSIGFLSCKAEQTTEQLRLGMLSRLKSKDKRKPVHANIASAISARRQASDLNQENAQLLVERATIACDGGLTWRADSRLRNTSPYRMTYEQAQQIIKDIKTPVQLIYGDQGLDMVAQGLADYAPFFKHFVADKLSGGHHVHMEKPIQTANIIESFVKNCININ